MKCILLVAGYATRLYPLTLDKPKALLEVGGRPILDHIYDEICTIDAIQEILLVSNEKFYSHFAAWAAGKAAFPAITVLNDGTTSDENKLGAIGDIRFVLHNEQIHEDILVMAGDNIFTFPLKDFYKFYQNTGTDCICAHTVDDIHTLQRMGVAILDASGRVLDMEEKPQHPKSNIAVDPFYIYRRDTLPLFDTYIDEGNKPDAPGYFPSWLHKRKEVYAFCFHGECYDIGTPDSYAYVQQLYSVKSR